MFGEKTKSNYLFVCLQLKLVKGVDTGKKEFEFLKRFGHFSDLPQLN